MLFLRKLFFYIFLIIYLIVCPLIILYAFGFILRPDTGQLIKKTGLIYLSTVPAGASIYLDGEMERSKTPASIQELDPGVYTVKLTMDSYKGWSHRINVAQNKASVFDKILLIPEKWQPEQVLEERFDKLTPLLGTDFFLINKGPALKDWYVYRWRDDTHFPLLAGEAAYSDAHVLRMYNVDNCSSILFYVSLKGSRKYLYLEPDQNNPFIKDVTELFTESPERIGWDASAPRQIFTFQNGYLNMLEISDEAVYPKYISKVAGFGFYDKKIYVLDEDYTLTCMDIDKGGADVLLDDKRIGEPLFSGKGLFMIEPAAGDIILFIDDKGELITNHLPYRVADNGIRGTEFNKKNRRLLIWQKNRVGVVDFLTEVVEGITFEKGPELLWVDVKAAGIEQAFWVYEDSHILFRDRHQVSLIEMEESGNPHLDDLIRVKPNSSIVYTEDSGTLYYLDEALSALFKLEIIEQKPLQEKEAEDKKREKVQA